MADYAGVDNMPKKKKATSSGDPELDALWDLSQEYGFDIDQLAAEYAAEEPTAFSDLGGYSPEMVADSGLANIEVDSQYTNAEIKSMEMLENMSDEGLNATDRAQLAKIEGGVNRNLQGQMGAIDQQMQSRGISGSGLDLMSQQNAAQGAAERQAYADLEIAAQGQSRRENATMDLGMLGSQLGQQDFDRQARQAQAQDVINRFNTQNTNTANQSNARNTQNIANDNVRMGNDRINDVYDVRSGANQQGYDVRADALKTKYDARVDARNRRLLEKQRQEEKDAARNAAMGSVIGGVGGAVVGGPAGAAVGSQIGGAAGSMYAHGGKIPEQGMDYAEGGVIPGETNGIDSYADDTVEIMVQPGEIVIPETVAQSPEASAEFVAQENGQELADDDIVGKFIDTVAALSKRRI